ncbi:MAG: LOG family protein [Acidimicrobiia bacterium]|nr:LOG family protein [Acidimicrobiia bacterium]
MTSPDTPLDDQIRALISASGSGSNEDLVEEMIVTILKFYRDDADRGDAKLVNTALKELRYPMRVFAAYKDRHKVSIFGSARTPPDDPNYVLAAEFARLMTEKRNWMVITGAGPGIMQAGNEGAQGDSFGVNIRLPFEAAANEHVPQNKLLNFKYFFTRKLMFVKESHAFALFPGGFGTMDEAYEALTLIQTGKSMMVPVILLDTKETGYWDLWLEFAQETLLKQGMISADDLHLFDRCHDATQAADIICDFYSNYQSQRFVDGDIVLRMNRGPDDAALAHLNATFSDIVVKGTIDRIEPTPAEISDDDRLDLDRIRFTFNRRSLGRLRNLIDALNELPAG